MRVVVTAVYAEKKIQCIKGVRAVSAQPDLKLAKEFVEAVIEKGPQPLDLHHLAGTPQDAIRILAEHGVTAEVEPHDAPRLGDVVTLLAEFPPETNLGDLVTILSHLTRAAQSGMVRL